MTWAPAGADRHIVLVGKGITFDSGGLSLKPPDSMPGMKTDMAGGAAVIATMAALADLDVAVKVTGLVPMAENMPGAASIRPGDVVRHYGGRTDEVLNTDAEGRVVLADALAYAVATLSPDVIVDIATLTGAASVGLGRRHGALYATSPSLRDELLAASAAGGERLWSMPLVEDYRDALDSDIADLRNIGDPRAGIQRRLDRRRVVPPGVRRRRGVGAPRHRRSGSRRRRRGRGHQGRDRLRGAYLPALAREPETLSRWHSGACSGWSSLVARASASGR